MSGHVYAVHHEGVVVTRHEAAQWAKNGDSLSQRGAAVILDRLDRENAVYADAVKATAFADALLTALDDDELVTIVLWKDDDDFDVDADRPDVARAVLVEAAAGPEEPKVVEVTLVTGVKVHGTPVGVACGILTLEDAYGHESTLTLADVRGVEIIDA